MTTQELKNKIEKVLGNSIRCLLPSYWWKNLFHSVADRIDEVETTITENVNDMVVKSLKEFEAKHPDMASNTLYFTDDKTSAEARSNATKLLKWALSITDKPSGTIGNTLYVAVPVLEAKYNSFSHVIQSPVFRLAVGVNSESTVEFLNVPMSDGQNYNIVFGVNSGVATLEPASSSGGGSVMFVVDPLGDLTEEQKQNNSDAFLKVLEAEGAIDINIMVMFFIAKPNMVSVDNNGNLVLLAAGIDGGASRFIFTPEGDVTVETVEPTSSEGVEIRELRINHNLSDEDKAYNIETVELYKEGKALVITPITYSQTSTDRTDRMAAPFFVDLHTGDSTKLATFRFLAPQIDETDPFERGLIQEATVVISNDGSVSVTGGSFYDVAMSDTSTKAVQNKVIKKYIDDAIANVGGGGGGNIVVDTEMSSTSTNPVQNKVVYSELQKKQDTISDLADIRSGAALGKTALQSVPSEYVTESELTEKGYATTSQVNDKQDRIDDLEKIRSGAAKGATALQSEQYKGTVTGVKINGTTKNPSSGIVDLGTVITAHQDISGKQDNLVSGTNIKTINGQSILGEGNIEIKTEVDTSSFVTREELTSLQDEIIANEEVYAAAANDLLARASDNEERISSEIDARETLQEEFQMLKTSIIENEEVIAATLNDIEGRFGYWSDTYATKKEAKDGVQEVTNAMLENEEVIAAALANLNEQIANLKTQVESLISAE